MQDRTLNVELTTEPASSIRNFAVQLWPRMTEAKWLVSDDAAVMLDYALGRVSQRKLRLYAVACASKLRDLLRDPRSARVLETAERFADGQAGTAELADERAVRSRELLEGRPRVAADYAAAAVSALGAEDGRWAASCVVRYSPWWALTPPVESNELAGLLRHITGNPFRPFAAIDPLPSPARQLAEALYAGEDCAFALRDALLEAGQVELAEHFQETCHPKGCWALDAICGKE